MSEAALPSSKSCCQHVCVSNYDKLHPEDKRFILPPSVAKQTRDHIFVYLQKEQKTVTLMTQVCCMPELSLDLSTRK